MEEQHLLRSQKLRRTCQPNVGRIGMFRFIVCILLPLEPCPMSLVLELRTEGKVGKSKQSRLSSYRYRYVNYYDYTGTLYDDVIRQESRVKENVQSVLTPKQRAIERAKKNMT